METIRRGNFYVFFIPASFIKHFKFSSKIPKILFISNLYTPHFWIANSILTPLMCQTYYGTRLTLYVRLCMMSQLINPYCQYQRNGYSFRGDLTRSKYHLYSWRCQQSLCMRHRVMVLFNPHHGIGKMPIPLSASPASPHANSGFVRPVTQRQDAMANSRISHPINGIEICPTVFFW